jgi:hypothetical protein
MVVANLIKGALLVTYNTLSTSLSFLMQNPGLKPLLAMLKTGQNYFQKISIDELLVIYSYAYLYLPFPRRQESARDIQKFR